MAGISGGFGGAAGGLDVFGVARQKRQQLYADEEAQRQAGIAKRLASGQISPDLAAQYRDPRYANPGGRPPPTGGVQGPPQPSPNPGPYQPPPGQVPTGGLQGAPTGPGVPTATPAALSAAQAELARAQAADLPGQRALTERQIALQRELGTGQLGLGRDELGLRGELGRGTLAQGDRRLNLEDRTANQQYSLGSRGLDVQERLGTRGLDLQRELANIEGGTARDVAGIGASGAANVAQIGARGAADVAGIGARGALDVAGVHAGSARDIAGIGRDVATRGQDIEERLGIGSQALEGRRVGLEEDVGRGRLGLEKERFGLAKELANQLGGGSAPGAGTDVTDPALAQLQLQLAQEASASPDLAGDPRVAANRLAEQRSYERERGRLAAEGAGAGLAPGESGGFQRDLGKLAESRAQREGAYEAGLLGERLAEKRGARTEALGYGEQTKQRKLTRDLAALQAQLAREQTRSGLIARL